MTPDRLPALVNNISHLRRRGALLSADVLVEIPPSVWLLCIHRGEITQVRAEARKMSDWTLALRFDPTAWRAFVQPLPPPGSHDLMAMVKAGTLKVEGSLHPFMTHLLWFKEVFAQLRGVEG